MHRLRREEFFLKAAESDIGLNKQFANSQSIDFQSTSGVWKPWPRPANPGRVLSFLDCLLQAVGPWETCWLYKGHGYWFTELSPQMDLEDKIRSLHHAWPGLPAKCDDVLEADSTEMAHIISICYDSLMFGHTVWEDVIVIPQGGDAFFEVSHHNEVMVSARNTKKLREIRKALLFKGFWPY